MASSEDLLAGLFPKKIEPEQLLAEFDDLLRNRPTSEEIAKRTDDALGWLGRAAAAISHWDNARASVNLTVAEIGLHSTDATQVHRAYGRLVAMLSEGHHSVRMTLRQSLNAGIKAGSPFDYFDAVRKIVERAAGELYFIDPYLDAEFVSRYLPLIREGVSVRLLSAKNKWLRTLLPAVDVFSKQVGVNIAVRTTDHHDRFVFVDGKECYQSGASFKDGGNEPTALTQITDAFSAMWQSYDEKWKAAKVER